VVINSMARYDEDFESIILMAPCGDAIEVWEPVPSITSWCDECDDWHTYIPEKI